MAVDKVAPSNTISRPLLLLPMGIAAALLIGVAAGWLRYWLGFFVLIQGGIAGALLAWLIAALGRYPDGRGGPPHPGFPSTLGYALIWVTAFVAGEPIGLGLAQPWFDPWGWLGRVLAGHTVEPVFGLSSLGGAVIRSFAIACKGWFWVFLNLLDALLMSVLLIALPWGKPLSASIRKSSGKSPKHTEMSAAPSAREETQ